MTSGSGSQVPLPRWKRVTFTAILAIAVIALLEWGSRTYLRYAQGYDGEHLYQYAFDAYKNILPTPNYTDTRGVRHNGQGFRRDADIPFTKAVGTYRVFLMGASTGYGLGGLWGHIDPGYPVLKNSETIDAYLERELKRRHPDRRFEVINAAITSTWTHHELIYLNQTILRYQPDMVLFLDGFNDFYFATPGHDQFADYAYNLQSRTVMGDPTLSSLAYGIGWWAFRKSAAVHIAGRALRVVKLLLTPEEKQAPVDVGQALADLPAVFQHNALKMHRRIGLILRDEGVTAVFMVQPLLAVERDHKPMQGVEKKLFDFNISSYRPNYESFIRQARDTVVKYESAMAREVGAEHIDLTRLFGGIREQAYTDYAHLTPLGNEMVARRIADQLEPHFQGQSAAR